VGEQFSSDETEAVVRASGPALNPAANAPDQGLGTAGELRQAVARGGPDRRIALAALQRRAGNATVARLLGGSGSSAGRSPGIVTVASLQDALRAHERAHTAPGPALDPADGARLRLVRGLDDRELQLARWASAGLTPAQGRTLARDDKTAKGAKSEACMSSESEDNVFDAEAEEYAAAHEVHLDPPQSQLQTPMPVGYKPRFELRSPRSMGAQGNFPTYNVRQWFVKEPGSPDYDSKPDWGGYQFSIEMDNAGDWLVVAKVPMDDKMVYLFRRVTVVAEKNVADEAFQNARTASYAEYRGFMHLERTRRGGADLDQSKTVGAFITNEGPDAANPAGEADTYSFTYKVHPDASLPADRKPSIYRWWAIPRQTDLSRFKSRIDMGKRTEYKGEFALYLGEGEQTHFRRDEPGMIEIVCELVDANSKVIDTARYQQAIMGHRDLESVKQIDKFEAQAAKDYRKIKAGQARGLKAMHFDVRRNKTEELQLFVGPSADDPEKTMLVDLTPGAEYVEHEGADLTEAIKHLDDNNSYSTGEILIQVEGEPQPRRFKTKGESDLAEAAGKTGIGSMILIGLGVIAAAIPGVDVAAPFLITGGLGTGAASAGMSLADELRKAQPSTSAIALDITAIVGSLMGVGSTIQAVRMGTVELAMATATGRFFIYTGFAFDATGGILLAADTAEKIEQIRNSQMSEEEKIDAIEKLLLMAVATGGMIAFGAHDIATAKTRLTTILGDERLSGLRPDQVYTLGALDDSVLVALKKIPAKDLEPVATALAKDPRRAAKLSKAYGEKFINEVRANPKLSLQEIGEILGAESTGVEAAAIGGTRGPDVYRRDPAKGISTGKERFERGINSANRGRVRGATIDNVDFPKPPSGPPQSATLDLKVGGETAAVSIELKETSQLSGGPHTATGGPGPGRIVDLQPPTAPGGKWTAHVELDAATAQDDVKFVLGHELDEIADFIATKGAAGIGSFKAEAEAGIFVTWAKRGSKTPPSVTSHDRAAAREFLSVASDLQKLRIDLAKNPKDAILAAKVKWRERSLSELTANMGLRDPEHIELKLRTLRDSFDDLEATRQASLDKKAFMAQQTMDDLIEDLLRGVTVTEFREVTGGRGSTNLTEKLVAHAMKAEPVSASDFATDGIYGGHHDASLREFIAANPEYAVVLRAEAKSRFVTYRYYDQYRWNGTGPPPRPGDARYPTAAGAIDPGWVQPQAGGRVVPKTTFDDPTGFFNQVDSAITGWKQGLTPADLATKLGGDGKPTQIAKDPDLWMYFTYDPTFPAAQRWDIRSVYIDERWILANQPQATPPPGGAAPPPPPPPPASPPPVPGTPPPTPAGVKP
jgi:hypothetical protein